MLSTLEKLLTFLFLHFEIELINKWYNIKKAQISTHILYRFIYKIDTFTTQKLSAEL